MTASDLLLQYVRKHGWYSVANIFFDNEGYVQPHSNNGFICASPSAEMIFTVGSIDKEHTMIIESRYVTTPYHHIDFEQTVTAYPFEMLQHFDAMLFEQIHHYNIRGYEPDFPIPTVPSAADIEAIQLDPETGMVDGYPVAVLNNRRYSDIKRSQEDDPIYPTQIPVIDAHPDHPEWSNDKFVGLRIKGLQDFIHNQKLFCERMNTMFEVGDCE